MDKRTFLKSLGLGLGAFTLSDTTVQAAIDIVPQVKSLLRAKTLKEGDTIGIITPAGALSEEETITMTKEVLTYLGFKVKEGKYIRARYGNLAGKDQERLADLHSMFADKEVDGILCIRGGNGASRLLPYIDYNLIRNNPKVLLGYSDITALILAFYAKTGLVSFHGVVGSSTWSNYVVKLFKEQFIENKLATFTNPVKAENQIIQYKDRIQTITPGIVEGTILGGNLTLLTGLCGSPYLPDFKDAILFIEEIGEKSDRMDRMFCQLMNAGILAQIKGFIFGKCTDCGPEQAYGAFTLDQMLNDYIKPLGIPAYSGAMIGHISDQFLIPVGVRVRMDASLGKIEYLEKSLI
ncbi:S66 peptidase family protein [Sphingobacterium rhinopitheci]|uniref:S66 peptidase family protein n=1 Tax=Sphingobacterium rhinopitheci TaxID=2781960 RepID=UPI001F528ED8|nr:LD-carboxypeptidase [Sphingobacterium rhinopitheci]MCI0921366.1 LD-carboxypeptidase [Sphingobacterium rhinopitheci]